MSSLTQGTLERMPGNKNLGAENVEKLRETLASGLDEELRKDRSRSIVAVATRVTFPTVR